MGNPRPKKPSRPHYTLQEKAERARSSILDRELNTFSPMQKKFMDEVSRGKTIHDAALNAGYAEGRIGYLLLKRATVREELNRRMTKTREFLEMTRERVQQMVLDAYEVAKLQADAASMVRAASEINRMCGYYATVERKIMLDVTSTVRQEEIRALPDAELIRMAGKQMREVIEGEAKQIIDETVEEILSHEVADDADLGDDDGIA